VTLRQLRLHEMPSSTTSNNQTQGQLKSSSKEFKPENMDHLVQEIRENLKLGVAISAASADFSSAREKSSNPNFKLKSSFHHRRGVHRSSPYAVPPSSRACDTTLSSSPKGAGAVSQLRKWNHQRRRYPSTCMNAEKVSSAAEQDPEDPFQMLQELITDGSLIKEAVKRLQKGLIYQVEDNKTFYDSEDDLDDASRTPPPLPLCSACEVGL